MLISKRTAALLVLLAGVQAQYSVTFSIQSFCAVTGSTVKIPCIITKPSNSSVVQRGWYRVQSSTGQIQHLSEDPQYSGRVYVETRWSYCDLELRNVRVSDSGVYNFRFKTHWSDRSNWTSASSGVQLTVNGVLGEQCWGVTYTPQHVCALKGSSIDLPCSYKHPAGLTVVRSVWFVEGQVGEPLDVREDEEYRDRVKVTQDSPNDCRLTITNLREKDTRTYRFRFYTDDSTGRYTGTPGVSLTVTDLKVTLTDWSRWETKLTCTTTSCSLSNTQSYIWYQNGQRVPNRQELYVYNVGANSYSCAVKGYEDLRSPAVCVFENCWSVTYPTQSICSLIGSSVEIHSYFTFPDKYKVIESFWFVKQQSDTEPVDVREDEEYRDRVQFTHNSPNHCRLTITNLTEKDTQTYGFRFLTDEPTGRYTVEPGVSLTVTDLKVVISDWFSSYKKLICTTSCSLSNTPSYIWYKNGQQVPNEDRKELSVYNEDAGSYSCALKGYEDLRSPAVYPPRNLSVTVVPSVSGDSITLLCTSDSNPVSSYTWYRKTNDGVTLIGNGTNLTLSSRENGVHYCTARNGFGSTSSSEWTQPSDNRAMIYVVSGVTVALVLVFIAAFLWMRRKKLALRIKSEENNEKFKAPVYSNVSATTSDPTQTASSDDQGEVQYASIHFTPSAKQEVPLYSTVQLALNREEEQANTLQ